MPLAILLPSCKRCEDIDIDEAKAKLMGSWQVEAHHKEFKADSLMLDTTYSFAISFEEDAVARIEDFAALNWIYQGSPEQVYLDGTYMKFQKVAFPMLFNVIDKTDAMQLWHIETRRLDVDLWAIVDVSIDWKLINN